MLDSAAAGCHEGPRPPRDKEVVMSSRTFSRSMVTALLLCALLALAAPPAQASGLAGGLLGGLSAKVHSWAAAWWPAAAGTDSRGGIIDPNGKSERRAAAPVPGRRVSGRVQAHRGRVVGPIRPGCNGPVDPNGRCM